MYSQLDKLIKEKLDRFLNKPVTENLKQQIQYIIIQFVRDYIKDQSISKFIQFDVDTDNYGNVSLKPANIFTLGILKGKVLLNLTDRTEGEFRIEGVTYGLKLVDGKPETYFIPPTILQNIKIETTINLD